MFQIPPKYNDWGVRVDRPQPYLVRAWADIYVPAGRHTVRWDGLTERGTLAAAGVYFVRLDAQGRSWTRKVLRIR